MDKKMIEIELPEDLIKDIRDQIPDVDTKQFIIDAVHEKMED